MSKFEFEEYHSILAIKKSKKLPPGFETAKWIATEKVHGSNFSFICDGARLACGRRNSLLEEHETFFNYQLVKKKYEQKIFQLFQKAKEHIKNLKSIVIYGELFGGIYPHDDVSDLGHLHIQKGVYYSPDLDFYAFDIAIVVEKTAEENPTPATSAASSTATATTTATEETSSTSKHPMSKPPKTVWMDYDLAMQLFEECGFFYAKPLITGTFKECIKYDTKFNSTIPALLGLPPIAQNQCEGIVVKSVQPMYDPRGSRVIYKIKNAKFEEVNPQVKATKYEMMREARNNALEKTYQEVERYITTNRIDSVTSKLGVLTKENKSKIIDALTEDALKDFKIDNDEVWQLIDEEKHELVYKSTRSKASMFIENYMKENSIN